MVQLAALSNRQNWRTGRAPLFALAFGAALATGVLLSPPTFRSIAAVGLDDGIGRLRPEAVRTASDLAMSRPVLLRAASRLIETKSMSLPPTLLERLGILAGVNGGNTQAARLADNLQGVVRVRLGTPGALELGADAPEPTQAVRIAGALADALVAQRDVMIADARRTVEATTASRLSALRNVAATAHRHLTSLAGTDIDLAQAHAAAAAQVAAADSRVATLRTIIGSGTPPLGDSKDMPQSIETLQTAYLDLTRKLAVASETLGDRHTTIIALQEGVRRTSAALTAEWKRLLHIAEADLSAARQREMSIGRGDAISDAAHQAAIDEARRNARIADEAVARAEAQNALAVDEQAYHLVTPALVPTAPAAGWSLLMRIIFSFIAGTATLVVASLGRLARRRLERPTGAMAGHRDEAVENAGADLEPPFDASRQQFDRSFAANRVPTVAIAAEPFDEDDVASAGVRSAIPSFFDPEPEPFVAKEDPMPLITTRIRQEVELAPDVRDALGGIVDDLVMIAPEAGAVPTIMVAANEISSGTLAVALGVVDAAVERGMRVLLVEGPRQRPELAGLAEPDCEPMLSDLFGNLRVVLQAEHSDALCIAPFLKNGANIAAALVRNTQAPFLDDLASEFDIIVVDGCRAPDSVAAGFAADRYLRVGRFASRRETDRFLKALDVAPEAFVGTVAGSSFVPPQPDRDSWRPAERQPIETPYAAPAQTPAIVGAPPSATVRVPPGIVPVAMRPAYPRRAASR